MKKVYSALRLMEVHKNSDPRFARSLKPLLPFLSHPNRETSLVSDSSVGVKSTERRGLISIAESENEKGRSPVAIAKMNLDGSFTT